MIGIPAPLQTGLNNNSGSAFFRAFVYCFSDDVQVQPTAYEIHNLQATVTFPYNERLENPLWFYIERGLRIDGINHSVYSSRYYVKNVTTDMRTYITAEGHIFRDRYIQTPGALAANVVLANAMDQSLGPVAAYPNTLVYPTPAPWWKTIQFFPYTKDLNIKTFALESLLKQKYLTQLCDLEDNTLIAISSTQFEEDPIKDFSSSRVLSMHRTWRFDRERQYAWTDENNLLHNWGDPDCPVFNLGFIHSTVDPSPAFQIDAQSQEMVTFRISMPQLQITSGDTITLDGGANMQVYVREVFDTQADPAWYQEFSPIIWNDTAGTPPPYEHVFRRHGVPSQIPAGPGGIHRHGDTHGDKVIRHGGGTILTRAIPGGHNPTRQAGTAPALAEVVDEPINVSIPGTLGRNNTIGEFIRDLSAGSSSAILASGWIADINTWTYSSVDGPTGVISINADMTGLLQNGMRIKLTQTTIKYFIVTDVGAYAAGATLITVYGGTSYFLANAAISSPCYSPTKAPYGFPTSPSKWTVSLTDTGNRSQAAPVAFTYYNINSHSISIPIGHWRVYFEVTGEVMYAAAAAIQVSIMFTLSNTNNSVSDSELLDYFTAIYPIVTAAARITFHKEKLLTLTSKVTYYLNMSANVAATSISERGDMSPTHIRAVSAYL
jgi:hypothetical protein